MEGISTIKQGFDWLINFFKTIFDIILIIIDSIVLLYQYMVGLLNEVIGLANLLPNWLKVFALLFLSLNVAMFVLNRTGGKV